MEDFTFVVLTYNQEEYIIEHLESIRYQIEHFGKGIKNYIILSDDCSSDSTVSLAQTWMEHYKNLFADIQFSLAKTNEGTVANYTRAIQNIRTKRFKLLAGDDLYYQHDIYSVTKISNFVITPTLRFNEEQVFGGTTWLYKKFFLMKSGDKLKSFFLKYLKYKNQIEAPGVFWEKTLADEDFFRALEGYRLIEDAACWHYLVRKQSTVFTFYSIPAVMYRMGSGISTNQSNALHDVYIQEREKLRKNIFTDYSRCSETHNPYTYWYKCMEVYYKALGKLHGRLRSFKVKMNEEAGQACEYLTYIQTNARDWQK